MVELRNINGDNIEKVVALEVGENQRQFIQTTNMKSFADAHELNGNGEPATPLAIYADEVMVGFLMYTYDTLDHESFEKELFYGKKSYFIWHYMIDRHFQGNGYGKSAFKKMLTDIETFPHGEADYISLFYQASNVKAETLYNSFGFEDTGLRQDQSVFAIKNLHEKT